MGVFMGIWIFVLLSTAQQRGLVSGLGSRVLDDDAQSQL